MGPAGSGVLSAFKQSALKRFFLLTKCATIKKMPKEAVQASRRSAFLRWFQKHSVPEHSAVFYREHQHQHTSVLYRLNPPLKPNLWLTCSKDARVTETWSSRRRDDKDGCVLSDLPSRPRSRTSWRSPLFSV